MISQQKEVLFWQQHQSCMYTHWGDIISQVLTFTTLWANSTDGILEYFSYFFQKIGFDSSCKLSPGETICIKFQSLFSGKMRKKYFKVLSVEFFSQHAVW